MYLYIVNLSFNKNFKKPPHYFFNIYFLINDLCHPCIEGCTFLMIQDSICYLTLMNTLSQRDLKYPGKLIEAELEIKNIQWPQFTFDLEIVFIEKEIF